MTTYTAGTAKRDFRVFVEQMAALLRMPPQSNLAAVLDESQRVTEQMARLTGWLQQQAEDNGFSNVDEYAEQARVEESQRGFANV